jgi:hypothetical protein
LTFTKRLLQIGGSKTSEAKKRAAKENIKKRWDKNRAEKQKSLE